MYKPYPSCQLTQVDKFFYYQIRDLWGEPVKTKNWLETLPNERAVNYKTNAINWNYIVYLYKKKKKKCQEDLRTKALE